MDFLYHIHIMTLFPDVVGDMLCESILGRAQERGIIRVDCHQIRDYTLNKQKQVDNYPYGGGHGAVMQLSLIHIWYRAKIPPSPPAKHPYSSDESHPRLSLERWP